MIHQLFDGFESKLTTSKWAKMVQCSADTAIRDMQGLIHKGMLKKEAAGAEAPAMN